VVVAVLFPPPLQDEMASVSNPFKQIQSIEINFWYPFIFPILLFYHIPNVLSISPILVFIHIPNLALHYAPLPVLRQGLIVIRGCG